MPVVTVTPCQSSANSNVGTREPDVLSGMTTTLTSGALASTWQPRAPAFRNPTHKLDYSPRGEQGHKVFNESNQPVRYSDDTCHVNCRDCRLLYPA